MKAVVVEERAGRNEFAIRDVPDPRPGPEDLLVRVHASSLNQADLRRAAVHFAASETAAGTTAGRAAGTAPVAGLELAGEVIGLGASVTGYALGDRVMAMSGGGWAEQAVVDHRLALPVPDRFSWSEAAATSISYVTAHDALASAARLAAGESVLVRGATTSAGLATVQIARILGADPVIGTTRDRAKLDPLTAAGCHLGVCTADQDLLEVVAGATGDGVDAVIDVVGGDAVDSNLRATRVAGRIVCLGRVGGTQGSIDLNEFSRRRLTMIGVTFRTRRLDERIAAIRRFSEEIWPHLDTGALRPVLAEELPMDAVGSIDTLLAERATVGKLTIRIAP